LADIDVCWIGQKRRYAFRAHEQKLKQKKVAIFQPEFWTAILRFWIVARTGAVKFLIFLAISSR